MICFPGSKRRRGRNRERKRKGKKKEKGIKKVQGLKPGNRKVEISWVKTIVCRPDTSTRHSCRKRSSPCLSMSSKKKKERRERERGMKFLGSLSGSDRYLLPFLMSRIRQRNIFRSVFVVVVVVAWRSLCDSDSSKHKNHALESFTVVIIFRHILWVEIHVRNKDNIRKSFRSWGKTRNFHSLHTTLSFTKTKRKKRK